MRLRTDLSGRPLPRQNARLRTRLAKLEAAQRLGLRPAYSSLRCEAAAQAAYRRMMRFWAGLPAGPYLAGVQGCVPRGWPSSRRPRPCLPACLKRAAMRGCCSSSFTAVRGGFGLAPRAGPHPARVRGCVPRGSPSPERLGSASRPTARREARLLLRQLNAAQGGTGPASRAGPYLAGMRGCVPSDSPSSRRLRLGLPACL